MTEASDTSAPESEQLQAARELLQAATRSVLSTHSVDVPGYPFGSVAPYCLDGEGRPLILISALAQHSRNLRADARASLILLASGDDMQAGARLTLLGDFSPLPAEEIDAAAARYYRFFPNSRDHHKTLDFSFWRLQPVRARFIGGFARIHWLSPERLLPANPFLGEAEAGIVEHMNADHADALIHYCRQASLSLPPDTTPLMVGLDSQGLHLRIGERLERIAFPQAVHNPGQARAVLVAMARAGRE